jgi:hypothetical protein
MTSDSDEFVRGLRVKSGFSTRDEPPSFRRSTRRPYVLEEPRRRLTRGVRGAMMVGLGLVSFWLGGVLSSTQPQPPETKTIYVPATQAGNQPPVTAQPSMSDSCLVAIKNATQLLQQASHVGSSTDKVLDAISQANQAALKGDTKGMNAASMKLRALDLELSHDKAAVMIPYQSIMNGLATCPVH